MLRALAPNKLVPAQPAAALPPASRTADTKLGELFLRLLPRHLYYGLALVYPLVTAVAGVGAVWAPAIVQFISSLPLVQVCWGHTLLRTEGRLARLQ